MTGKKGFRIIISSQRGVSKKVVADAFFLLKGNGMISLNDYLYSGNTVLKILHLYENDLRKNAQENNNKVDLAHSEFLLQIIGLLERNDFLSFQSQRIREYYKFMTREYPFLAFTFHGRIKSLFRAERKFNAYIIEMISDAYSKNETVPSEEELIQKLKLFRDLIAYRLVISYPHCHLEAGEDPKKKELEILYRIAGQLPEFMEKQGFQPENAAGRDDEHSPLEPSVREYYKDFVASPSPSGYRSLHITFFDSIAKCYTELQLRTKEMDDYATIGPADHMGYEQRQEAERLRREMVPPGVSLIFDEAWKRMELLRNVDLTKIDVNMFSAYSDKLINDGCGLVRGRLITPFEHLSRFQNDMID